MSTKVTRWISLKANTRRGKPSYTYHEIRFDAKFIPIYRESEDGQTTILEMHKLNAFKDLSKEKV